MFYLQVWNFCRHTRNSGRTSPLAFDAEIEKTTRKNRVSHRAAIASSSENIDLEPTSLDIFESENSDRSSESEAESKKEVKTVIMARGVDTYYRPGTFEDPSPIVFRTSNNVPTFQLKHSILNILPTFRGTTNEEPYDFIYEFFSIADTHEITGLTKDDIRLRLFSYTLKDRAKHWFNSLPRQSVTTWADMQKLFLEEFYPISKTSDVINKIKSFRQIPGELFHESFERLNDLLRSCPHHDIPKQELVKIFYDSLDASNRQFLLAASGGLFLTRSSDEE